MNQVGEWADVLFRAFQAAGAVAAFVVLMLQLRAATQRKELVAKVEAIHTNVATIEIATNSMKDDLVKATAIASHLQGMSDQRDAAATGRS